MPEEPGHAIYGLMAEFDDSEALLAAIRLTKREGYEKFEAFSPQPFEGLSDALELKETPIPLIVLCGGIFGAVLMWFVQYYASALDYPLNVGGRPLNSWPSFIPIAFQMSIMMAVAFALFFGVWAINGLPHPYHPVFNVPAFARSGRDRYFLCIESADPRFERTRTRMFLEGLDPVEVHVVPN